MTARHVVSATLSALTAVCLLGFFSRAQGVDESRQTRLANTEAAIDSLTARVESLEAEKLDFCAGAFRTLIVPTAPVPPPPKFRD